MTEAATIYRLCNVSWSALQSYTFRFLFAQSIEMNKFV